MVALYNEEDWIEPPFLSIKDLVDVYIIIDSCNENTSKIIERLKKEHGLDIKYRWIPLGDLAYIRNLILARANYRWILHWDGDFIIREDSVGF